MFKKKQRKPIFVEDSSRRRPLTTDDLEGFNAAVDLRPEGTPDLNELLATANQLKGLYPVEARATERYLKWLCKAASKNGRNWTTPWL